MYSEQISRLQRLGVMSAGTNKKGECYLEMDLCDSSVRRNLLRDLPKNVHFHMYKIKNNNIILHNSNYFIYYSKDMMIIIIIITTVHKPLKDFHKFQRISDNCYYL